MASSTETIRLLHLADVHIGMENYGQLDSSVGVNSRVMDFLRCLDEAVGYALQNEIDVVVFAGDAFKTRDPNSTYRREFARRIKKLADGGIPVLLLVGNHDLPSAPRRASSVDIFQTLDVPHVTVANQYQVYPITTRRGLPLQVAAIPYPIRSRLLANEEYKNLSLRQLDEELQKLVTETIRALVDQLVSSVPAVLAAHLAVAGAVQGSEQQVMVGRDVAILKSVIASPAFDYVALGHIHKFQDLNPGAQPPVVYAGSIERIDFGEEREEKGFVVADIAKGQTTYRFVPVQSRRFITIAAEVHGTDPMTQVLDKIARYDVAGAVVRVVIRGDEESGPLIQEKEIRQALQGAHYISSIHKELTRSYRQRLGASAIEELTPREALRRYLEDKKLSPERIERLLAMAEGILQEPDGKLPG